MMGTWALCGKTASAATTSCQGIPTTTLASANGDTSNGFQGCETADKVFGTFVLGSATTTGSGGYSPTSLSGLYILGSGSAPNVSGEIEGGYSNQWSVYNGDAGSVSQTLSWVANVDPAVSNGALLAGVTGGSIVASNTPTGTTKTFNGTVQITENICPAASFSPGCAGEITIIQGLGPGVTPTVGEQFFSTGLTSVASIQTSIIVTSPATTDFAGLTDFSLTFNDSPEPATFLLLGSALAAIAALRFRGRKQQS